MLVLKDVRKFSVFPVAAIDDPVLPVAAGDASPRHLAYLADRVLVAASEPQVYRTQYTHDPDGSNLRPQPAADPDRLDGRRAAMGLEPAAEYDRRMRGY